MRSDDYLRIYMNDQLALGVLWRDVARRARRNNEGNDYGEPLARVASAIAEDVATFAAIMERLGIRKSRGKVGAAAAAERVMRLKANGSATSYSPLARFEELEFLAMGIEGKKILWTTLRDFAGIAQRLPDVDFGALIERAEQQRADLEPWRARAGTEAFRE